MALQNKTKWAQLRVGLMTITAMVILVVLLFLITGPGGMFASKTVIYTYMDDSQALADGSPVRLNGIVVGKVTKIGLSGEGGTGRIIRIDLEVEEKYLAAIPVDSQAAIGAENLLGAKYINIKKGKDSASIRPGATLKAKDTSDFNDVIEQGNAMLVGLQSILKRVDNIVAQVEVGKGSIGKLLVDEELYNKVLAIVNEVDKLAVALNDDRGTIGKLLYRDEVYNDVRKSLARIDNLMEGIERGEGSAGKLLKDPSLYNDTHTSILEIKQMLADLNAGKGSAGKLLKSDELHNQIAATLTKVDVMIDKVNSGQGTLGQLLVNPQLYDSLNGATKEMTGLLQDFRANPKKFLRIKLGLF